MKLYPRLALLTVLILLCTTTESSWFSPSILISRINAERTNSTALEKETWLRDNQGNPTSDDSEAAGISTEKCYAITVDNAGWKLIDPPARFLNLFSTWVVPFLALTAQLPFETRNKATNLLSLLLALGSPFLITYSLSLYVLDARRINRVCRYLREKFLSLERTPETCIRRIKAMRIVLKEMLHNPIRVQYGPNHDLAQMIVGRDGEAWWSDLAGETRKQKREMTLSLFTQLGWVAMTLVFTIIAFFSAPESFDFVTSLALLALWSWMLPVVWGWPYVGTQNFARTNKDTLQNVTTTLVVRGKRLAEQKCFAVVEMTDEVNQNTASLGGISIAGWTTEPGPIFAFARVWLNATAMQNLQNCFEELYANLRDRRRVSREEWNDQESLEALMSGTPAQMEQYIAPWLSDVELGKVQALPTFSGRFSGLWINFFLSLAMGMFLQWTTTGAAIMIAYQTPTVGLGCVSGSYLIYGLIATFSGFALIISASLSHSWQAEQESGGQPSQLGALIAIVLRYSGSCAAILNALWIVVISTLQLTNLYNNCWCQASAAQNGIVNSWVAVLMSSSEMVTIASRYWIAGLFLSIASSILVFFYVAIGKGDDIFNGDAE